MFVSAGVCFGLHWDSHCDAGAIWARALKLKQIIPAIQLFEATADVPQAHPEKTNVGTRGGSGPAQFRDPYTGIGDFDLGESSPGVSTIG